MSNVKCIIISKILIIVMRQILLLRVTSTKGLKINHGKAYKKDLRRRSPDVPPFHDFNELRNSVINEVTKIYIINAKILISFR